MAILRAASLPWLLAGFVGAVCLAGGMAQAQSTVSTWREQAENTNQITATLASKRSVTQTTVFAEGARAFQMAHPNNTDETVVLNPVILPGAATKLFF
ncbi:MAG: hypothetical protein ACOYOL_09180 [Chthoniobacterales bacterium]